jgi:hypothetical protein
VGFTLQDVAVTKAPGILGRLLGTGSIDLFHSNTVEWMSRPELAAKNSMYSLDNVVVTIRHQDTIAIIDWKLKKLVWAWGQGVLSGPHDGTVIDNGNILVFDNGLARGWSRVLEVDPIARKIVWEYKAARPSDFFSVARGACQRFANGNTLITNSDHGQAFEVPPDGEIVWEFLNPLGDDHGRRATIPPHAALRCGLRRRADGAASILGAGHAPQRPATVGAPARHPALAAARARRL